MYFIMVLEINYALKTNYFALANLHNHMCKYNYVILGVA